jgi:DNA helicase-2/ATP-dependent DNA helicase PcrA
MTKPTLVIAGPGAGKTFNMVETILDKLPSVSASRYMAVITYTNSATDNIRARLSKRIVSPPNLFVGTMHSFLNKFIVIPFSSLHNHRVGKEKLFLQCQTDDVFASYRKAKGKTYTPQETSVIKTRIKDRLNEKGYISFDQTVALAKACLENDEILKIVSNRIQHLFVDEFQDTNNSLFSIIDDLRKQGRTEIYCVGDPEQFIQSFDIKSKVFTNIPILKALGNSRYDIQFNTANYRSSERIVEFLNNFNSRIVNGKIFRQESKTGESGEAVKFISAYGAATNILIPFDRLCAEANIITHGRCVIAKRNEVVNRIGSAVSNNFVSPGKRTLGSPIKAIADTLLSALNMSQREFCTRYKTDVFMIRKYSIAILKAITSGVIRDENTFGNFVVQNLGLQLNPGIPVKIDNLRVHFQVEDREDRVTLSNIHTIKGLEAEAVLAIAKTEAELLLWLETDRQVRESYRDKEKTDYPRLGYVAFSRAKRLLCIACLQQIGNETKSKLEALGVLFYS